MPRVTQALLVSVLVLCFCDVLCDRYLESRWNEDEQQIDAIKRAVTLAPGCGNKPADIMFVLDESSSIYPPDFQKAIYFVGNISQIFDVRPSVTRIGVMTYSDKIRPRFGFRANPYFKDVAAALGTIKQNGGNTYTFDALQKLRTASFAKPRKGAAHIAMVITDGASDYPQKTKRQARLLKQKGITVFALGIGPDFKKRVPREELASIASSPKSIYMKAVDDYGALDDLKKILAVRACKVTTEAPPPTTTTTPKPTTPKPQMIEGCKGKRKVDIVFALPDQLGVQETSDAIDFIQSVAKQTHISPKQAQLGVCGQQCHARPEIYLRDNKNKGQVLRALEKLRLTFAPTDLVLSHMRTVSYGPMNGARPKSVKFGILIINKRSTNLQKTWAEASRAKKRLQLITIGVGKYFDRREIEKIASGRKNTFIAKDYESLMRLKAAVVDRICRGIESAALRQGAL